MKIAHAPAQLPREPRAVAIGMFDGVHRGHQAVMQAAVDTGLAATVITFEPHPRVVLGNRVELITTLERRLELLGETGVEATLVAGFTPELMRLEPEEFAETYLRAIGAEVVIAGDACAPPDPDSHDGSFARTVAGKSFEDVVPPK